MRSDPPAIKLTRQLEGWHWELIDADGQTTAAGRAMSQQTAMQSAWGASKDLIARGSYPELTVVPLPASKIQTS
jgi:hypothetical protein